MANDKEEGEMGEAKESKPITAFVCTIGDPPSHDLPKQGMRKYFGNKQRSHKTMGRLDKAIKLLCEIRSQDALMDWAWDSKEVRAWIRRADKLLGDMGYAMESEEGTKEET